MSRRIPPLLGLAAAVLAACGGSDPSHAERGAALLERGVRALFIDGKERPLGTVVTRARGVLKGAAFEAETWYGPPDRFRFDMRTRGSTLTEAYNGREAWGMLDGTVIDLEEADVNALRAEVAITRASLLTPLRGPDVAEIAWLGESGEGSERVEILRVDFRGDLRERLELHFDPRTALLRGVVEEGRDGAPRRTMRLSGFRGEAGRMIPFESEMLIGDRVIGRQSLETIRFDADVAPETFERPRDLNRDCVAEKELSDVCVVAMDHDGDPDDAPRTQEKLLAWMRDRNIEPAGGPVHVVRREAEGAETRSLRTLSVCFPVTESAAAGGAGAESRPPDGDAALRRLAPVRVLSTVHVGRRGEIETAYRRLAEHAEARRLSLSGEAREIYFKAGAGGRVVAQVQVALSQGQ